MSKKLTPKQKRLVELMPLVQSGELTKAEAIRRAGYSPKTADQQQSVLGSVRTNSAMQEALRKHGVTEDALAVNIGRGMGGRGAVGLGYNKLGAELLDAFPAKKTINADVGIEQLLNQAEMDANPSLSD